MSFSSNQRQNASNQNNMKMMIKHLICAAAAMAVVFACTKPEGTEGSQDLESAGNLVATVESSTPTSVTFSCDLTVNPDAGKSFRAGIMYSTSQRFTTTNAKRAVIENPVDGTHALTIDGLVFSNTYYYSTYVYHHGNYELSEVYSFTTADVEVESEVSDLQHNEVTISGQILLDENTKGVLGVGVKFSNSPDFSSDVIENALDIDDEGRFSTRITGLDEGTTYYYACYVSQGSRKVYKETQKLTTMDPYSDAFGDLDASAATDLSAVGSANSYIVTGPGLYKFKAVQGNSTDHVGEVATVNVLWESYGTAVAPRACELISATSYKDDYAVFNVPADFKEGNALIAAKNSDGDVLWSWHIWLISEQPGECEYANGAGTMMDRNLGALSMEKGDAKGFGLLYQWGRKDPFPGSANLDGSAEAVTTGKPNIEVATQEKATIQYATKNPQTLLLHESNNFMDWLYPTSDGGYDDTRWQSVKTKYDPCPVGWRVPDGGPDGIWAKAGLPESGAISRENIFPDPVNRPNDYYQQLTLYPYPVEDSRLGGFTVLAENAGVDTWYPCAGGISAIDLSFYSVGKEGFYWSVTSCNNANVYGLNFYYYNDTKFEGAFVFGSAMLTRSSANSVRCCREN